MADTLSNLQQDAQSIQSNTGVKPTNSNTALSLGASPDSAKMIGSSANQAAAIKESVAPKNTLAYLQRTAGGRTEARAGQSKEALEKIDAAKQLAGIAGKVGAAQTQAVQAAVLPLDVKADISNVPNLTPENKASLELDMSDLVKAFNNPDPQVQLDAYAKIKKKYQLDDKAIAGMFKVDPAALQAKISSNLGSVKIKVADMLAKGYIDQKQVDAAKAVLLPEDLEGFDNLSWPEAKVKMEAALDAAQANTDKLMQQASDLTLPPSTRSMALQRLKELGMSGEMQAAAGLEQVEKDVEAADNVKIGDKTFEVNEVLNSPEAAEAIKNVLQTGDLKSLDGTPFEGLKPLIENYGNELAKKFGIQWDGSIGQGKLQATETLRKTNETSINNYLSSLGVAVPSGVSKDALKTLGISDDTLNGYVPFDSKTLSGNRIISRLADPKMPADEKSKVWSTLGYPGITNLLKGDNRGLESMLFSETGRASLQQLSKATEFVGKSEYTDDQNVDEEVNQMFKDIGFSLDDNLMGFDFGAYGVKIPDFMDTNKDGKIDDKATLQKTLVSKGADLEAMNAFKQQLASAPGQFNAAIEANKNIAPATELAASITNPKDYLNIDTANVDKNMELLKQYFDVSTKRKGAFGYQTVYTPKAGVSSTIANKAIEQYKKLFNIKTQADAEKLNDTRRTQSITTASTLPPDWGAGMVSREQQRIAGSVDGLNSSNPEVKAAAVKNLVTAFDIMREGFQKNRSRHNHAIPTVNMYLNDPTILQALKTAGKYQYAEALAAAVGTPLKYTPTFGGAAGPKGTVDQTRNPTSAMNTTKGVLSAPVGSPSRTSNVG